MEKAEKKQELLIEEVLSSLPQGSTVLDAGCGKGSFDYSAYQGLRIVSVDCFNSPQGPNSSKSLFCKSDLFKLPFGSGAFDLCIYNFVLEHVERPQEILLEARRVLKKNGLLYIATPNAASLEDKLYRFQNIMRNLFLFKFRRPLDHKQKYSFSGLLKFFYENGFYLKSFCLCPAGFCWLHNYNAKGLKLGILAGPFIFTLRKLKRFFKLDLFKDSNFLMLLEAVETTNYRDISHVCKKCGYVINIQDESRYWKCPRCKEKNAV